MKQKISNHTLIGLERDVVLDTVTVNYKDEIVIVYFEIEHSKDGTAVEYKDKGQPEYLVLDSTTEPSFENFKASNSVLEAVAELVTKYDSEGKFEY